MSHPLDSSRAKIERAREHYRALVRDAAVWMVAEFEANTRSMTVRKERDQQSGKIHFIAESVPQTDPFRWGLYLGDVVQNLRGALDHLAFAVAKKDSPGRSEDRDTQFVIVSTPTRFNEVKRHLKHMSVGHQDMIEREQPYKADPSLSTVEVHPLTYLERLSNIDKHRVIHVVQFGADPYSYSNPAPFILTNAHVTEHMVHENPLEEGARLMTVVIAKVDANGPDPDVDMEPVLFAPTLALGPGQLIKYLVPNLIKCTGDVVERFAPEF